MPSSPPSVRPVLAALLTVLLLTASALVSGPATLMPAAHAEKPAPAPQAPSAPPAGDGDAPVSLFNFMKHFLSHYSTQLRSSQMCARPPAGLSQL